MKMFIFCALASGAMVTAAVAQNNKDAAPQRFNGVKEILIENFTGRLEVEIGGAQTSVALQEGGASFPFDISQDGATLALEGEERPRNFDVQRKIKWRRHGEKAFAVFLRDYPVLKITAPEGTTLNLEDAITIASIGDLNGALIIDGGYVDAVAGDVASAKVSVHSSGDLILGAVRDDLIASIYGSGDITAESAGASALSIYGSGDIGIGDISGDATLKIHGSGDIDTGDIDGGIVASVHGSGDINAGAVSQGGDFAIYGSGDMVMRRVNGLVDAKIRGSGNIEIEDGRAENLNISINGSGDFSFDGVSSNLTAYSHGSGSIEVARNTGSLNLSGTGAIRIGDRRIKNDD
jgi:putative autotransporter adhesin-like protein